MNRQLGGKGGADASEASPLSLLVHAADAQHQRPTMNGGGGDRKAENGGSHGGRDHSGVLGSRMQAPERPRSGSYSLEDQLNHHHAAQARAEAFQQHHQGLFAQLRAAQAAGGGHAAGLGDAEFLQQNAALVAAQQQQQAAALALASDIRTAVAAAQLRQAAQFQNQDLLMARAAAVQQQLGALGGAGAGGAGVDQLHQELELQRLEELERRQLLAAAAGAPLNAIAARQQMELQEAHLRQEQLDRQLHHHQQQQHQQQSSGGNPTEAVSNASLLERAANMRQAASAAQGNAAAKAGGAPPSNAAAVEQASARAQQQAAEVAQSKDTFQKTPGSVVVPCRARGMPMDHNFKTAYFVIPENVEHGEELICSYFACRNAGIKFRYCTHCKVPVAKRNFRKRHKHGKSTISNEDDGSVSGDDEAPSKKQKASPAFSAPDIPQKMDMPPPAAAAAAVASTRKAEVEAAASPPKAPSSAERQISDGSSDGAALPPISAQQRPRISAERKHLWSGLLAKRPPTKDGEAVSGWLMEVLSVSDLDTPLKENGTAAETSVASGALAGLAAVAKGQGQQSVLKNKKRPLALLQKEDGKGEKKGNLGSFSDWKDRKKNKLPKKGTPSKDD